MSKAKKVLALLGVIGALFSPTIFARNSRSVEEEKMVYKQESEFLMGKTIDAAELTDDVVDISALPQSGGEDQKEEEVEEVVENTSETTTEEPSEVVEIAEVEEVEVEVTNVVQENNVQEPTQVSTTTQAPAQQSRSSATTTQSNNDAQREAEAQRKAEEARKQAEAQAKAAENARVEAERIAAQEAERKAAAEAARKAEEEAARKAAEEAAKPKYAPNSVYVNGQKVGGTVNGNTVTVTDRSIFNAGSVMITDGNGNGRTVSMGAVYQVNNENVTMDTHEDVTSILNGSYGVVFICRINNLVRVVAQGY